ncbi:MAG: aminoacyl-tRNA hydrolase [Fimbriiglobus sp.]|jgi:ribosome-associated protein|nr:aminoacyl-tRNA hydrolase [Fimbriiglobus sp.]
MIAVTESVSIPDAELSWEYARSGGPGGQNVNKVASKATLRWAVAASAAVSPEAKARLCAAHPSHLTADGEFLVTSQEYRDQERNRQRCEEKLADMVRAALTPPKPRKKTKPTKASQRRRLDDKKRQGEKKSTRRGSWE